MAYNSYGAFVYKDRERREDHEDVPVFDDSAPEKDIEPGLRVFYNIAKLREQGTYETDSGFENHCHHAVLGKGPIGLCGYKYYPLLYHLKEDGTVTKKSWDELSGVATHSWYQNFVDDDRYQTGWFRYRFKRQQFPRPLLILELIEPDGTKWTAKCGYQYGAGYNTWIRFRLWCHWKLNDLKYWWLWEVVDRWRNRKDDEE